jgi:hypothetical protein
MYTYRVGLATKGTDMHQTIGYLPLMSKDKTTLVQIFTDLETGLIESVQVAQRSQTFDSWGSPIEVFKVD